MYKAREGAKKKCDASGVNLAIKNGRHGFITEANWVKLIDYWMKHEWCVKSNHCSVNRKTSIQGSTARHTAGSVSFVICKKRLAKEKNRPVQFSELFDRTHSDPRGTAASVAYKAKMTEKYDSDDVTACPYNDDEVYLESMGKPKKGHFYGLGAKTSLTPLPSHVSSCTSQAAPTPTTIDEVQLMRGELNHLKNKFDVMLEETDERDARLMRMFQEIIDRRFPQGSSSAQE